MRRRRFEFTYRGDDSVAAPTEIFIPGYQYPNGCTVTVSDGGYEMDPAAQLLRWQHAPGSGIHRVVVTPREG